MTDSCDSSDFPDWVTFFIGPPGAPPERVEAYAGAVELAEAGNREALDEFLQIETDALKGMEDSVGKDRSPLCDMVSALAGERIITLETFVTVGFMRGHWTPILTIYLDRSMDRNGRQLGHLLGKEEGQVIASTLGLAFKAEWIQTVWTYSSIPQESSDNELSAH